MNDGSPKPGARWCTQTAQWINPEDDGDDLYDVACQCGEGKPVYTGMYKAPNDEALIELVCKMMGVSGESGFSHLDIFKTIPDGGGVIVVREGKDWPLGVSIIRTKGVTVGGRGLPVTPHEVKRPAAPEVKKEVAAVIQAVLLETSIPRVPYTLRLAV